MYRTICTELWTDPAIKVLPVATKLLFVYLITNPHTHMSGIYYLPSTTILKETGLKMIPYRYGIDTLSKLNKAHSDPHTETIFVVNMFQYQGRGPKNEASASKHLETLHDSPLIARFLIRYPSIPYRYPIQDCPPVPDPVPDLLTNPNSDLQSERHAIANGRNYRAEAKIVLSFLNEKTERVYRESDPNMNIIMARLESGVDVQTCKTMIMRKVRDWKPDPKMAKFLRPETLFNRTKFESYLAEVSV
jgi:uncharacterized phage protein (TIGR02220 family)